MTGKSMSRLERKFSSIHNYRLGDTRFSRKAGPSDHNSIVAGLTLYYGVLLDYNDTFCDADKQLANKGRIIKHADAWRTNGESSLEEFLLMLDEVGEILLKNLSCPSGFKDQELLKEIKMCSVLHWLAPIKGVIHSILAAGFTNCKDVEKVQVIRAARQMTCFLKKLDVDRSDLESEMIHNFIEFEEWLTQDEDRIANSHDYASLISEMKLTLHRHLDSFSIPFLVPGHGPGAVSSPTVKCWHDKNVSVCSDARIAYLLDHAGLGRESDYLPLITDGKSSRSSRYITVPKTWKKLRGISAEPAELQFWQQGLLGRLDAMFTDDPWWARRVNLHDQQRSRNLALMGSVTGDYATIDLSNASDSVTLQLVKDLFGNTLLGRWLLGTRSVTTLCGDSSIRIRKFAPMGSACCFPVECIIFCLAAQVAVYRTRQPSDKNQIPVVYGDDIIVPTYAANELLSILTTLGFTVNTEKSFWSGDFREACGVEGWMGHDIAPCRFRAWKSGLNGTWSDHAEIASLMAFANELLARGLHGTRAFLLSRFLKKRIRLGKNKSVSVQDTIFATFTGERNTLASTAPTNFNVNSKYCSLLQQKLYRRVVWQERPITRKIGPEMSEAYDICKYVDWLIRHQSGYQDYEEIWSKGWIECQDENPYTRLPLGTTMVPTLKWGIESSDNFIR